MATRLNIKKEGFIRMTIYDFNVKNIKGEQVSMETYKDKVMLIVNVASKCRFTPQYNDLETLYKKYKNKGLVVLGFPCNQFGQQEPGNEYEIASFCNITYRVSFPMFSKIEVNGENAEPLYTFLKEQKGFEGFPSREEVAEIESPAESEDVEHKPKERTKSYVDNIEGSVVEPAQSSYVIPGNESTEQLIQIISDEDPDYAENSDIKWNFTKFLVDKDGKVVARYEPMVSLLEIENDIQALLDQ